MELDYLESDFLTISRWGFAIHPLSCSGRWPLAVLFETEFWRDRRETNLKKRADIAKTAVFTRISDEPDCKAVEKALIEHGIKENSCGMVT